MANLRIARRSGLVLRGGRNRRSTLWFAFQPSRTTLVAASTANLIVSLNVAALALRPFTVVRSRGIAYLETDQVAASEFQDVAYGHIVVSDEAVAAGVAAVPTPSAQPASDWHVYVRLMNDFVLLGGVSSARGRFLEWDSKAMRKVDLGGDLIFEVETGFGSNGAIINEHSRVLVKLH